MLHSSQQLVGAEVIGSILVQDVEDLEDVSSRIDYVVLDPGVHLVDHLLTADPPLVAVVELVPSLACLRHFGNVLLEADDVNHEVILIVVLLESVAEAPLLLDLESAGDLVRVLICQLNIGTGHEVHEAHQGYGEGVTYI